MSGTGRRLVVIPSDPIEAYERAGYEKLDAYYNPGGFFSEVFVLSPFESGSRETQGMTIRQVPERRFRAALEEIAPAAVRAYGGHWPADVACRNRIPGVPVLVSVHDRRPRMIHRSLRYADLVLCVSRIVAEQVERRGVSRRRVRHLPNRVDRSVFRPISDPAATAALANRFPPGKHVLHVGRRCREKNPDTLIRALALLPGEYSAIFIGRGDAEPYVRLARRLGVADRCWWIDRVPNSQLPLWYCWCDCMCTPSRSEGFGIVFIEAAACGAAIVTSDTRPMNEYLRHGHSAHLVARFEDPKALAAAIQRVCTDSDYRRRLGTGAVEVAKAFDRRRIDSLEVAIYQEALQMPARRLTGADRLALGALALLQRAGRLHRLPIRLLTLLRRMPR